MSLDAFTAMYLDYVNNFITVEKFAEYYGITQTSAEFIIKTGREISHFELEYTA